MRYIFHISVGAVLLAIVSMLYFLYIDSEKQLSEVTIPTESDNAPAERGEVAAVIDGLTIKLASGHKIRYLGVRVPNVRQKVECYGKEALAINESVIGKIVRLESDPVLERAEDGAWLRYVFVAEEKTKDNAEDNASDSSTALIDGDLEVDDSNNENNTDDTIATVSIEPLAIVASVVEEGSDETIKDQVVIDGDNEEKEEEYMINERIIEMGIGFPLLTEEMIYFDRLASGMKYSRATKKGLWGKCEIDAPEEGLPQTNAVEECVIKGKVLMNGNKVYRELGCAAYASTVVLQYSKGDAWLCNKEDAEEGGWERAKDCK